MTPAQSAQSAWAPRPRPVALNVERDVEDVERDTDWDKTGSMHVINGLRADRIDTRVDNPVENFMM